MNKELERYTLAAAFLPSSLRSAALSLPREQQECAEEFRLRAGQRMTVLLPEGELPLEVIVEPDDLEVLCDLATEFSRYAAVETIREGYIPVRGGFRIGLCGTAVMKSGSCTNLRQLSSVSVRISREKRGIAEELAPKLFQAGRFQSTLLLSPPGGGKTTLLRDLIRCISDGLPGLGPRRVSVVDERGELAVCYQGLPQLEIGTHTDVMDACPKSLAIPMMLRAMNPQIIAVDEITVQEDLRAICMAAGCGVGLLATMHASCMDELLQKPLYRALLDADVFRTAVTIRRSATARSFSVENLPCSD